MNREGYEENHQVLPYADDDAEVVDDAVPGIDDLDYDDSEDMSRHHDALNDRLDTDRNGLNDDTYGLKAELRSIAAWADPKSFSKRQAD